MDGYVLFAFITATAVLAISPGPDNIFVLIQSITYGKRFGFATVCGLISGCIIHTTLLAFGISAVIEANIMLYYGIKIIGALYLVFLAFKVFKSEARITLKVSKTKPKTLRQLFVQGFFMNVLNPKVTLFFLAFFPGFLFSNQLNTAIQFYILGAIFMLVSFIVFGLVVLFSDSIRHYFTDNAKVTVFLKWLQIIVFVGIAIYILL